MSGIVTVEPVKLSDELQTKYDKLFQDGVLVNVHISVWGMAANLSKEDLNLQADLPKLFKLGKKMLIEPERLSAFKNAESKARRYLYRNSYDFPISKDAHFVPKKQYATVLTKLNEFKEEFLKLIDNFVENYYVYRDEVLNAYPDIADLLRPFYPDVSEIRGKFGFSTSSFELSMPREFSEVDIQKLIARDEAKDEIKKKLEEQMKVQHQTSIAQLEKFTEDAATSLRSKLVAMCKTVTEKIASREIISKANITTIREEIENFRALNFLDDAAVETEITKLAALVEGKHNFKTDQEAIATLNTALNDVLATASTTSDVSSLTGKYFRKIKV